MLEWEKCFSEGSWPLAKDDQFLTEALSITTLTELKNFLDIAHVRQALLRPFLDWPEYPLVDARSLLPSFEPDAYEYHGLPGFSLVVLDRPLCSFNEVFQYDVLHPVSDFLENAQAPCCPLEKTIVNANLQVLLARLPRNLHENFRKLFARQDFTVLEMYPAMLPYLLELDRAHVIGKNAFGQFQLSGVFASLPSDIDGELKRFGLRIRKFKMGDNELYERNRLFVMQFLMELYGFPIASERRTSAALFARRLHKMGERFLIRVLGQSDRVLTTIWNDGINPSRYPKVEKIALVKVDEEQKDVIDTLKERGAFVDEERRVILLRMLYRQHAYDPDNVRQDRALSVLAQQVIHPVTGEIISGLNITRDSSSFVLRLNDIVRGEFSGRIIYKRNEVVENTDTEEKRLKFLYAWLTKHQRRVIGYSDEFFTSASKVLDNYFNDLHDDDTVGGYGELAELKQEVLKRYRYIQQARKVRLLEEIRSRNYKGERLNYDGMLDAAIDVLQDLKFEISVYFDELVTTAIHLTESMLNDRYLRKTYVEKPENTLTRAGHEVRRKYGKLVVLLDEFRSIYKSHQGNSLELS